MGPEPGIDDNLLAAYAEGRLAGEGRARVEARLARDPEAREIVAALARDRAAGAAEGDLPDRELRRRLGLFAAAAVLVLGVGIALWLRWTPAGGDLARVAGRLAAESPDLLADLKPLDARELAADGVAAQRGGLTVLRPRGVLLDGRPTLEWKAVPGATEYDAAVLGPSTTWHRARTRETSLPWPKGTGLVEPGVELVAEVTAEGAFGRVEGRTTFSVAPPSVVERWLASSEEVRRRAPPEVAEVLVAHLALRRGFLLEAERVLRAHLAARPDDPAGRAVLDHVERVLGVRADG